MSTRTHRSVLAALLVAASAPAAAATYDCQLTPTDTCSAGGIVTVSTMSDGAVAEVQMAGYRRMDVFARVCDPTGWVLHLSDSPTGDGLGDDGGTTDHDAEAYLNGYDFTFFGTLDASRGLTPEVTWLRNAIDPDKLDPTTGCIAVQATFVAASPSQKASTVSFDADADAIYGTAPVVTVLSLRGPRTAYAATASVTSEKRGIELDAEDATLSDVHLWYVGVDRVVGGFADPEASGRTGSGVASSCVVLSTNGAEPASCAAPAGPCADDDLDSYLSGLCGGTDCDDTDPTVHPLAPDPTGDGIDQDCDAIDG